MTKNTYFQNMLKVQEAKMLIQLSKHAESIGYKRRGEKN